MTFIDVRRGKKERFMHGDNLKDYEALHRSRAKNIQEEKKKMTEYMRRKPYGIRKEGA